MPKVKKETAGKFSLVAAILYIIGNVVGIGIFFKNGTVFRLNEGNYLGVLLAWIISIVIVLCMALSFAEVSTCKMKNKNAGVGGWAAQFCGHAFGRYAKTGYSLIFWPANTFAIMFFAGEAILNCFAPMLGWDQVSGYNYGTGTTAIIFGIGAALFVVFMLLNYFKANAMSKAGSIISFVKFAPILMVVVLGIVFGVMYNESGAWAGHFVQTETYSGEFTPMGIISAIPAILFAFEGYISVGNISGDIENSERNLSLAVVLGVAIISVLYLAVTIGCITAGTGNVYNLMHILLEKGISEVAYQILTIIISIFIFICLIGCVNGMARGGISAYQSLAEEGALFKSKALLEAKPGNKMFAGSILFFAMVMFWWVILVIPSSILNTDAMADGSSTSMVLCLYIIYGVTVLGGFVNRFSKKVEVKKQKLFPVTAVIGILGCVFMVFFVGFVQFLAAPIININNGLIYDGVATETTPLWQGLKSGWGMFVNAPNCLGIERAGGFYVLTNIEAMAWFWGMTVVMALLPIFNDLFIKWSGNKEHQQLIWQKNKKAVKFA
ncbi:MAG: APC family permease [Mycoplasma sp.]|nr:APC family permease [Candidatus Hennigella equi]